jgi:small membrane protein
MIAKLILTFLLAGVVLYARHEQRRSPLVAKLSLIAATAGIYFVWVPSHASDFAAWAGVGRGVDLIIYIWVVISLLVMLNLHLKLRVQLELITSLARQSAIANARPRKTRPRQPATSRSPHRIAAIPASSRTDNASPNNKPPSTGVSTKASATNG